jgi:hypothetical protein
LFATAWLEHENHPGLTALVCAVCPGSNLREQAGGHESLPVPSALPTHASNSPILFGLWSGSALAVAGGRLRRAGALQFEAGSMRVVAEDRLSPKATSACGLRTISASSYGSATVRRKLPLPRVAVTRIL